MTPTMHRRAAIVIVAVVVALLAAPGSPALAQTAGTDPPLPKVRLIDQTLPVVKGAAPQGGMALWPSGRRGFQLAFSPNATNPVDPDQLVAIDLDKGLELGRLTVGNPATTPLRFLPAATNVAVAVDHEGGRLFVPLSAGSSRCAVFFKCIDSIAVVNASDLTITRTIPLPVGGATIAGLLAISYAPARASGDRPRLLLLSEEQVHNFPGSPFADRVNPTYLSSLDPQTGSADFTLRLDACTAFRSRGFGFDFTMAAVFRALDPARQVLYATCIGAGGTSQIVRVVVNEASPGSSPQEAFVGPTETSGARADPVGERLLLRVGSSGPESWWVFDGKRSTFVGVIGSGPSAGETAVGVDQTTGRLYVLAPAKERTANLPADPGGLLITDARRTPLPQAQPFPEFAGLIPAGSNGVEISVDPPSGDRPRRVYVRPGNPSVDEDKRKPYRVFEDRLPVSLDAAPIDPDLLTVDVAEKEGVAEPSYTGTLRGFGARAILVGGAERALNSTSGDISPIFRFVPVLDPCGTLDRDVQLGSVGPAKLTSESSDAQAQSAQFDWTTRDDVESPERCTPSAVQKAAPQPGAGVKPPKGDTRFHPSNCVYPDDNPSRTMGTSSDPTLPGFRSSVRCGTSTDGSAHAQGLGHPLPVAVADAGSTYSSFRDPTRGLVTRVESFARGIDIGGVVQIDAAWSSVEVWANGRRQPSQVLPSPNCDLSRSAGSCLRRSFTGITINGRRLAPDDAQGDQLAAGMERALGREWRVRIRQPDPQLRKGSPGGYQVSLQKPPHEQFADTVLLGDPLLTVPALEVIRIVDGAKGRGRQVFQFAAVEASTTYGIQLIPQEVPPAPAKFRVELTDEDGAGLSGGVFEVHRDEDGDGTVGLVDELIEGGSCVTTDDGTGGCSFSDLEPGPYVVQQVAAPSGYQASPELAVELVEGRLSTAEFKNLRAIGRIEIALTDDASPPVPLSGSRFAVAGDDGDGAFGPGDKPYAECTTDAQGECAFDEVPLGAYVVHQTEAPTEHLAADDAAFTLEGPGQTARVTFVTGLAGTEGTEGTEGSPGEEAIQEEPVEDAFGEVAQDDSSVEIIIEEGPPLPEPTVEVEPISEVTPAEGPLGRLFRRLVQAPEEFGRFLARNPGEALLFGAVWLLFGAATVLIVRRRSLHAVTTVGDDRPLFGPGTYLPASELPRQGEEVGVGGGNSGEGD